MRIWARECLDEIQPAEEAIPIVGIGAVASPAAVAQGTDAASPPDARSPAQPAVSAIGQAPEYGRKRSCLEALPARCGCVTTS